MVEINSEIVKRALDGDRVALEELIILIKDDIYNLSVRMLWNPADAEDVTQEILIKVITNLSQFRGESKFTTWVYKIASNYLINTRKRGLEHQNLSFDVFEKGIKEEQNVLSPIELSSVDRNVLAEELKISCTHAMLLCLSRGERIIYILSAIFNVKSNDGADMLEVTPEAYRKRLSRVKEKMRIFMESNCGLINHQTCDCNKRVDIAVANHRIQSGKLLFVNQPLAKHKVKQCIDEMESLDQAAAVFQSHPEYLTPDGVTGKIRGMIFQQNLGMLEN